MRHSAIASWRDLTRTRKIDARVRWLLFGEEEEENLLFS